MTFCKTCVKLASESTQVPKPKIIYALYNIPGNTPKYCKKHFDKKTMVNVTKPTCEVEDCPKQPSFNYFGQTKGIRCSPHKLSNMVDVVSKKCEVCIKDPKFLQTETNPAPEIPIAYYGGKKFCIDHRKDGMKVLYKMCATSGCTTQASFNIAGQPPKYCGPCGRRELGDKCVNVNVKHCKHGRQAAYCAEPDCMGSRICSMCCERQRISRCRYTIKSSDPSKADVATTLCITCYNKAKLGDLLAGKTPEEALKILKKKCYRKMKEARVLKTIVETFFDKTWNTQSHVPMCDMKLTNKRYLTDLGMDIGALYQLIVENDENQHATMKCDMKRMNDIVAANGGRHLVFIRFNPDKFKHNDKKYPSMFDMENEPTEIYQKRMPEVIKIIDREIQRAALLEQSAEAAKKDSLIRIVFINYDDTSTAVTDAVTMVGEEQVKVYHVR